MFYLALGKKGALMALCKAVRNTKLHDFLSNDFTTPRWRSAALKNAFSLLTKQKHELAIAFFLLGGDFEAAVRVCTRQLSDLQLAVLLCRLHASHAPELLPSTATSEILPYAREISDVWLAAVAHLLAQSPMDAVDVLSQANSRTRAANVFEDECGGVHTTAAASSTSLSASSASVGSVLSSTASSGRLSCGESPNVSSRQSFVGTVGASGSAKVKMPLASSSSLPPSFTQVDGRTRLLPAPAYEPATTIAFVRELLSSPLLRMQESRSQWPYAQPCLPSPSKSLTLLPPSSTISRTGGAAGVVSPPTLPSILLHHSIDAFCRGGTITLSVAALLHFDHCGPLHLRRSRWARRMLALRYALQSANAIVALESVWPPTLGSAVAELTARVRGLAPALATRLRSAANHLKLSRERVAADLLSIICDTHAQNLLPLAGALLIASLQCDTHLRATGRSHGFPDALTPGCNYAASFLIVKSATTVRAVLSSRLPMELSAHDCIDILGDVCVILVSLRLAVTQVTTSDGLPSMQEPSCAEMHDRATVFVALLALAVRLNALPALLECVKATCCMTGILCSAELAERLWQRLWSCAVKASMQSDGPNGAMAASIGNGDQTIQCAHARRGVSAGESTPATAAAVGQSVANGLSHAAATLAPTRLPPKDEGGGEDLYKEDALAYARARLLNAILERVDHAIAVVLAGGSIERLSESSSVRSVPQSPREPMASQATAQAHSRCGATDAPNKRGRLESSSAPPPSKAVGASLPPLPLAGTDSVPAPIAPPRAKLQIPMHLPTDVPLSDPSAALPYGIHALLRQWSGLLQVRLGTLAAQLTMDAFPLDAIAASSDSTEDRACIADMWALLEPEAQAAARPATDGGHSVGPTQPLAGVPPPPLSLPNLATERIHQLWPLPSDELTTSRSIDVADSQHSAGGGPSVTFDPGGGGSAARSAQPVRLSPPVTLLRRKGEFVRAVCANSLNSSQLAVALTKGVYQLELVSDVDHAKMPGAIHDGPVLHTKLAHSLHSGASHTGSLVGGQLAAWGIGLRKATSPYATLVGTPKGGGSAATQLTVHWQSLGSNLVTRCLYSHPKVRSSTG